MKLNNLQILRFVAASMVLFSHVQHQAAKLFVEDTSFVPFEPVYWAGGVDIFFVISGFIMYYIASEQFGVAGAPREFLLKRLARIAPPYWFFTMLMVLATFIFANHISHPDFNVSLLVSSLFFVPKLNNYGMFYPVLMLGWTLNFEFFFYLVFSVSLLLSRRIGIVFIAVFMCFVVSLQYLFHLGSSPFAFYSNSIVFEFLFGIALAILFRKGWRLPAVLGWVIVVFAIISMVVLQGLGISNHFWEYRFLWMGLPALVLCAGFVLIGGRKGKSPSCLVLCLSFFGDASYSLYLSHPFSLNFISLLWVKFDLALPWLYVAASCVISLACAIVVYFFIEMPMVGFFARLLSRRRCA